MVRTGGTRTLRPQVDASLRDQGYVVLKGLLTESEVGKVRTATMPRIAALSWANQTVANTIGAYMTTPAYAELFSHPKLLEGLKRLGLTDIAYLSAVAIFKVPGEGRRPWHQDWFGYGYERFTDRPPEVGVMWYLSPTSRDNGCLRVVPGSHRPGSMINVRTLAEPWQDLPGEINVCTEPGDALVVDARLLHAAHANTTREIRPLITVWYIPFMDEHDERVQAYVTKSWGAAPACMEPVRPRYAGTALPLMANYTPPLEFYGHPKNH